MTGCHHCPDTIGEESGRYRRILWLALFLNALMFAIEVGASIRSGSTALLADSIDFASDAANYGMSLFVLNKALQTKAKASLIKGFSMAGFGIWVLVTSGHRFLAGTLPHAETMGIVGFVALLVNLLVAVLLYQYRRGDSNRTSAWLCTRNDAIGNIAVMLAAGGVYTTQSSLPDLAVAFVMGVLAFTSGISVIRHAQSELQQAV